MNTKIERLKLFHFPASRSARVKWMLHEVLGDDFELEIVPLYEGAQYQPDFLQKNPNHCVPMLECTLQNGETHYMLESGAMVAWLGDAFPEKGLAPPANEMSVARADYLQMLYFGASWMDMMLWQIRIHEHILPEDEQDDRTIARYRKKFADEVEPQLSTRLLNTAFICGDEFTAADCIIGHNVTWARAYTLCQDDVFRSYVSRLAKRPAFQSAFADASEFSRELPEGRRSTGRFSG